MSELRVDRIKHISAGASTPFLQLDSAGNVDFGGSFGFHKFDMEYKRNGHSIDLRDTQVLEILNDTQARILKMPK